MYTYVLDSMTHHIKPCNDFKSLPFLVNLNAGFFSVATNVKHRFPSFGTFTVPCGYSITELHLPVELFFVTSKIIACSWLKPAWSFAFASDSTSCWLSTNSWLSLYHPCLSIETCIEFRPVIISVLAVPHMVNSKGESHCHMVINCTCIPQAERGSPCTLVYR